MFYKANPLIFARAKDLRNHTTHPEIVLWGFLKTKPYGYKFRRQHPLGIYIADFFCFKLKLVIEVDGGIHNDNDVKINDGERQKIIESDNIKVIRFSNEEVMKNLETVIVKVNLTINEQIIKLGNLIPPSGG